MPAPQGTGGYHPHESPWSMLAPLGLLSIGAIFAGMAFHGPFLEAEEGVAFWRQSLFFDTHLAHAIHETPLWVKLSPAAVMIVGFLIALRAYILRPDLPGRFVEGGRVLYRFLLNKWYFDEIYRALIVRPTVGLGRLFWRAGDQGTIDRFGPNGVAAAVRVGNVLTARLQSGYLYAYAFVMLLGLVGLTTWAMTR